MPEPDEEDSGPEHESDDELVDTGAQDEGGRTVEERFRETIRTLREFCDGLEYQVQFNDLRMVEVVERESAGCLRLAKSCLSREKTRGSTPTTWEKSSISALFYRPRPQLTDVGT